MKFSTGSIGKGMLPLLDIALLLFGIMIIVLTFARINVEDYPKETSQPYTSIVFPGMGDASKESYRVDKNILVENVVKKLNEEGRLLYLRFSVEGQVRYTGGNILYDGQFYPQILELLVEYIEKNDPLVVVAYPDTGNKPNMATYERVQTLKNEVSKYSDMVTEISYLPKDIEDNMNNN